MTENHLDEEAASALLQALQARFEKHEDRHQGVEWSAVVAKLKAAPAKLYALQEMENSGGEPDVVGERDGQFIFMDCAAESPAGRRSTCYDREGWEARKEHRPENTAVDMAADMGVELLNEEDYRMLQGTGAYDLKTSSWILTPDAIRKLGGALFCDRRYDQVFTYHNGAQSYYAARGFRAKLVV